MNLENALLNEISQSQKDKYCMIPPIWSTIIGMENRLAVCRGWAERGMGSY
jgi:hypothetical protein